MNNRSRFQPKQDVSKPEKSIALMQQRGMAGLKPPQKAIPLKAGGPPKMLPNNSKAGGPRPIGKTQMKSQNNSRLGGARPMQQAQIND